MTTQLVEKSVTVTDPRDGTPLAVTIQLELSLPECTCDCAPSAPRRPVGYGSN